MIPTKDIAESLDAVAKEFRDSIPGTAAHDQLKHRYVTLLGNKAQEDADYQTGWDAGFEGHGGPFANMTDTFRKGWNDGWEARKEAEREGTQ